MCLYPKLLKNKKYTATKKNKGNIPAMKDDRVMWVAVGCGRCMECAKKLARNWRVRLQEELRINNQGKFVTLTFSNEELLKLYDEIKIKINETKIPENEIATIAVRRFLERWRKKHKKSVKHWLITELGHNGTERIHLHGLIFTENSEDIYKLWYYGNVYIGDYVNDKSINYIVKYVTKMDIDHKGYKPKILCSPGIGSNYLNRSDSLTNIYNGNKTKEFYRTKNGTKLALPTYYRNKIYTEEERELLWLNLLDKNIRYIGGVEVPADNEDLIFNIIEQKRILNKQLGFGDDSKEWDISNYKNKIRLLNKYKRK